MKKKTVAIFSLLLSDFYTVMRSKVSFMQRDKVEFAKEGVTQAQLDAIGPMLKEYNDLPTDDELLGDEVIATQAKNKIKEQLHTKIEDVLNKVANKYGAESGYYRKFGIHSLSKLDGGKLLIGARRVLRVGKSMLTDLAEKGLTQAMLTDLETVTEEFDVALANQEDTASDRGIATDNRIEKANAIYTLVVKYCDVGKRIWVSTNEAKYNDYVIYDTPSGKPEEPVVAKA